MCTVKGETALFPAGCIVKASLNPSTVCEIEETWLAARRGKGSGRLSVAGFVEWIVTDYKPNMV